MSQEHDEQEGLQMSFLDHLDELRKRLIYAVISIAIAFALCFAVSKYIFNFLKVPVVAQLQKQRKLVQKSFGKTDPAQVKEGELIQYTFTEETAVSGVKVPLGTTIRVHLRNLPAAPPRRRRFHRSPSHAFERLSRMAVAADVFSFRLPSRTSRSAVGAVVALAPGAPVIGQFPLKPARLNTTGYRRDLLWIAAMVHRVSGLLLALFLPLHFLVLGLAIDGEARLQSMIAWTQQPAVKIAEAGLVVLLAVHLLGGLRVLFVEGATYRQGQKRLVAMAAAAAILVGAAFVIAAFA